MELRTRPSGSPISRPRARFRQPSAARRHAAAVQRSINSFANNEIAKFSPGESALMKLMADACERGCDSFDLGVGEAYYKDLWCDTTEPLFDCFVPITPAGHVYAQIKGLRQRVKRSIKQNPVAWGLVQRSAPGAQRGGTAACRGASTGRLRHNALQDTKNPARGGVFHLAT
ncbi:MAG: GNAT family N-acetyltransferase [Hyphomicrobiales bacterium]